jgi:hypothetical protein
MPLQTLVNAMMGYILSIGLYVGVYYGNAWGGLQFPFLSRKFYRARELA